MSLYILSSLNDSWVLYKYIISYTITDSVYGLIYTACAHMTMRRYPRVICTQVVLMSPYTMSIICITIL